jgi:pimeloyl-ACP methyl ester carboxylesterase
MGGGEVAQTEDNPQGPLTQEQADDWTKSLTADREAFFDQFTTQFFSAGGELKVTEAQRQDALAMCLQSGEGAALACMESFGTTDFRPDLPYVTVPALVLHGDADGTIPFEGSGQRTHLAIPDSELVVLDGAPHGCNVSHARELSDRGLGRLILR